MRYEPHRLRVALEKLERPFDTKFNNALKEILLVIDPFEELEKWVAEIEKRVKLLEECAVPPTRGPVEGLDYAKEEAQEEEKEDKQGKGEKDSIAR